MEGTRFALTYSELDQCTDQLAAFLRVHNGARPEAVAGIFMERCEECVVWWCLELIARCRYVIALIAVLKTGAAYCPIELAYPGPLLSSVFDEVQPCVTITKREWAEKIPHGLNQFMLDDGWIDDVGGP